MIRKVGGIKPEKFLIFNSLLRFRVRKLYVILGSLYSTPFFLFSGIAFSGSYFSLLTFERVFFF